MRDEGAPGVLAGDKSSKVVSEIHPRDEFNRTHLSIKGMAAPQDLRKMDLPERS